MIRKHVVIVAVAWAVLVACAASCSDGETVQPCTGIPAGGCPLSHGVACDDPACDAVYACRSGNVWELDHKCPPRADAGPKDGAVPPEAAPPFDASIDAPPGAYGGPGCGLLQAPDCALGTALSCPSGCCGCEDLFVCQGGGWALWGSCSDAGIRQ